MRVPSDLPPRRPRPRRWRISSKWRLAIVLALVLVLVLVLSARSLAGFYVESLWFRSVGRSDVFWGVLRAKVLLAAACTVTFAVLAYVSLAIADRVAPRVRPAGPEEEVLERVRSFIEPRRRLLRGGICVLFGIVAGLPAAAHWEDWLLFRHAVKFGVTDPQFGEDVSWYVFRLPFLNFLIGWLFAALVVITLLTAIAHYLNGGIRTTGPVPHVTPHVKLHVSVLLAGLAVLKAAQYWLRRYGLTTSTRGFVQGAGYTDVKAQLPALNLLILISVAAAVLLIWNVRQRGWRLPVIAVGLWAVIALVAGTVYPAVIQKFRVEPSQSKRERPYIQRNIDATQRAFGLDTAVAEQMPVEFGTITTEEVKDSTASLANVRLLDPKQDAIKQAFTQQRRPQGFYQFTDLDVDRYVIDGKLQQVVLAARVVASKLPNSSWENTHLAYTHGHGLVAAPASRVQSDGRPAYLAETDNSAVLGAAGVTTRPEIYVGDGMPGGYVVLGSSRAAGEIGPQGPGTRYEGTGGVRVGGVLRRLAFALNFGEYNLFGSGLIEQDSRVLWVRDVRDRVAKVAPFLSLDADPYPVAADGGIKWVVDAYTTTARYPYSEDADTSQLDRASGLRKQFNYVRNSVKAVVDAYDGAVTLYLMDPTDPIATAWAGAFPNLMKTADDLPASLRDHLRYPEDLLRVQTAHLGKYHLTQADDLFNSDLRWCVTQEVPGRQSVGGVTSAATAGAATAARANTSTRCATSDRFVPYYSMFTPPGGSEAEFTLLRPFAPFSPDDGLQVLRAFAAGTVGDDLRPRLRLYTVEDPLPTGPYTAHLQIQSELSQVFTLDDSAGSGSQVLFGDMQLVPVGDGLVYVRPVYVVAETATAIPDLRYVVVLANGKLGRDSSLSGALNALFPGAEIVLGDRQGGATTDGGPTTTRPGGDSGKTVGDLLAEANALFEEADTALKDGDLGLYQAKIAAARQKIDEAEALLGQTSPTTVPASSPTTTVPPPTTTAG